MYVLESILLHWSVYLFCSMIYFLYFCQSPYSLDYYSYIITLKIR